MNLKKNILVDKYNRPVPRYTSYPPVPFWHNAPSEEKWSTHLQLNYDKKLGIDLYVHVPYCEKLCYYCACNRTVTKNHAVEMNFVQLILKEWHLYQKKLGKDLIVHSLHLGGGTPTFLSPENLEHLLFTLLQNKSHKFIGSVELDPRTCQEGHIKVFQKYNFKRASLGIQDFDPEVQKKINRIQPPLLVKNLVQELRSHSFDSLNFDLIYGLPKQSLRSIRETMAFVTELKPDLIAMYSYAHLPEKIANQNLINENDLPSSQLKHGLHELGKKILKKNNYFSVGIDHFALPSNFLYKAKINKKLKRSFMGYIDEKSSILIGLGPSAISDSSFSFIQNNKEIKTYENNINAGALPIENGHIHNENDLLIKKIILEIMCHHETLLQNESHLPFWEEIDKELSAFEDDGILKRKNQLITLTPVGKKFSRNVAMCFDYYLRDKTNRQTKFSQAI